MEMNQIEQLKYLKELCKDGPYKFNDGVFGLNLHLGSLWLYYLRSGFDAVEVDLCMSEDGKSETVKTICDLIDQDDKQRNA